MQGTTKRLLLALALGAAAMPALADDPFGAVRVAVNRSEYHGRCPAELIFTGNVDFNLPHPRGFVMNYYWERSDGAKSPTKVVRPGANQRMLVVRETWRVGGHGQAHDVFATLHVNSGNTHLRETSRTVRVVCR